MDDSAVLIHADMRLISEMPGVALLTGFAVGIALLFLVLRGGGGFNKGGIDNRSLFQDQLFFRQLLHDQREELLLNAVLDEDVPESPDCIPVRHLIAGLYFAEIRKSTAVDDFVVRCTEVRLRRTPRIRA